MIYRIFSSLATFKGLEFKPGLNVLIAQKETGASDKQTRNRAGKTSLIEIIHFLTGSIAGKASLFRTAELANYSFGMEFDLGKDKCLVQRSGRERSRVSVSGPGFLANAPTVSNSEWAELLSEKMFRLGKLSTDDGRVPTFRSLFAYFVRRQL